MHGLRRQVSGGVRWPTRLVMAAVVAASSACDESAPDPIATTAMHIVEPHLIAGVQSSLDTQGRFLLARPTAPDGIPMVSEGYAGELAQAYLRSWGVYMQAAWNRQRGAPVAWDRLEMDTRILFAESPYQRFPDGYHPADRRYFGPRYLVHFRSGSSPVLTVAVSAYATDVQIRSDGTIALPPMAGNEFMTTAVSVDPSVGPSQYSPVTPEEAAVHVAELTGAKVAEVPRLILRGTDWDPVLAQWRIVLDRSVRVRNRGSGQIGASREVYVSSRRRLAVAGADQPAGLDLGTQIPDANGRAQAAKIRLPRRPEIPTEFEVVSLGQEI